MIYCFSDYIILTVFDDIRNRYYLSFLNKLFNFDLTVYGCHEPNDLILKGLNVIELILGSSLRPVTNSWNS